MFAAPWGPDIAALFGAPEAAAQQARGLRFPHDPPSGGIEQGINALLYGQWDRTDLSFGFPSAASDYQSDYFDAEALATFGALNAAQTAAARAAFENAAAVSGLTFTEFTGAQAGDADLRLALSDKAATAYAYFPHTDPAGGDVFFNHVDYTTPAMGNYPWVTVFHEIGHGLGLKHGHETAAGGASPFAYDSMEFSLMTYRSWVGKPLDYGYANETWGYAQTLMLFDIAALQKVYGANFDTEAGDTVYEIAPETGELFVDGVGTGAPGANRVFRTLWDGGGEDTYDFSQYRSDLVIDLQPGGWVDLDQGGVAQRAMLETASPTQAEVWARGHLFNALQFEGDPRSLIENADGGRGDDTFTGNDADNRFRGMGGDDQFIDSFGADFYNGGGGVDSVLFPGVLADYGLHLAGRAIEVVSDAVDRVAASVERFVFADADLSRDEVLALIAPPSDPSIVPLPGPVALDDVFSVAEDGVLTGSVIGNDTVPPGATVRLDSAPSLGSVTLAGDGSFAYQPTADAFGRDAFAYVLRDGTTEVTAQVAVEITPVNDAPVALGDAVTITAGETLLFDVLANDVDIEGDALTVASTMGGSLGTATVEGGALRYTAGAEAGVDIVHYVASDGSASSGAAAVTVTVLAAPTSPVVPDGLVPEPGPGLTVVGTSAKELFTGTAGPDRIDGDGAGDTLIGGDGADSLFGNGGWDLIAGGAGDDTLDGGRHTDVLTGGPGADLFVFDKRFGADTVTDFALGVDQLAFPGPVTASDTAMGLRLTLDDAHYVTLEGLTLADLGSVDILM